MAASAWRVLVVLCRVANLAFMALVWQWAEWHPWRFLMLQAGSAMLQCLLLHAELRLEMAERQLEATAAAAVAPLMHAQHEPITRLTQPD